MLLKITGSGLRSDCCEISVEYDHWIGLDEPAGTELLKKLKIVGVMQWRASDKPAGRLSLMVSHPNVSHSIRLIKHVLFQHFTEATIHATYPH
jgi:hypothetical protein